MTGRKLRRLAVILFVQHSIISYTFRHTPFLTIYLADEVPPPNDALCTQEGCVSQFRNFGGEGVVGIMCDRCAAYP